MQDAQQTRDEIFLLYNEREEAAVDVAAALRSAGLPIYFARQDLHIGGNFAAIEATKLAAAPAIVVLLGELGWGPTQREIATRIFGDERIVPAIIGQPPEHALDDVGGLFRRLLYADLRHGEAAMQRLVQALLDRLAGTPSRVERSTNDARRFDEVLTTLLDGSDVDRSHLLDRVRRGEISNGAALASRLREALQTTYAPDQRNQAVAARPRNWLTSIRSWMLSILLWLEPESDETGELALRYLRPDYEPSSSVRFWVLAGIIQQQLSYQRAALELALTDPAPEVSGLATIASDPERQSTLVAFRLALSSRQFDKAWHVLRILRIYPVPQLTELIVPLLERGNTDRDIVYDALFALSHPEMAPAVRIAILNGMGVDALTAIVLREAREVAGIARRAFAAILSMFDIQEVRAGLTAAAQSDEDRRASRALLADLAAVTESTDDGTPLTPGHANDNVDISRDSIGIARDVRTLASVMLSREVEPPLAIGLFGEWGSGKSFYIKSIEAEVSRIAARASANTPASQPFCGDVVQIHFNAWHYVDTNLWASLVSHLLDGLAAHLTPHQSPAHQRSALTRELASAKEEMAAAEQEQRVAGSQLEKTALELEERTAERQARELKLRDFRLRDLSVVLEADPELQTTLNDALKAVGAPTAAGNIQDLNDAIEQSKSTTGRAFAFAFSLFSKGNIFWLMGGIAALLIVPPLLGSWIETFTSANLGTLSAIAAQVSVIAVTMTGVLQKGLVHANSALETLARAKKTVDDKLAEVRSRQSDEETQLEKALIEAKASEKAASERVAAASGRAQELEARVAALIESQSLGFFVSERTKSDDYRRHLGLISTIRKDFESLMQRIHQAQPGDKSVERIILYIDDVDRCPPEMVVDILQAVHLLLAYKLFVVVVSVDPRWLLRSLESRVSQLQPNDDADVGMIGTPQDYLEKIFQIPFTVRPMGQQGFATLMRTLFASATPRSTAEPAIATAQLRLQQVLARGPNSSIPADHPDSALPPMLDVASGAYEATSLREPVKHGLARVPEVSAEQLVVQASEVEFAALLHDALVTPRSAKRFANIYRLLKASVPQGDLTHFEGTQGVRGDFQLPMLLLAVVVGRSHLAQQLFPRFLAAAQAGRQDWWEAGWDADDRLREDPLRKALTPLVAGSYFPRSPDLTAKWLPKVARFSFTTARIFLQTV